MQLEGVDKLLDLLEVCPNIMKAQVLGFLAELCSNSKAIAYYQAWKSPKRHFSATQLLLQLYAEEEKRLGVERPRNGIIENVSRPLECHKDSSLQGKDVETTKSGKNSLQQTDEKYAASPAFSRLKQALVASQSTDPNKILYAAADKLDLRSKIYSVLCNVGFPCLRDNLSYDVRNYLNIL